MQADINGDLNQDLIHYNPFASGMYPVLGPSGGYNYALGIGNDTLGTEGTLPGSAVSAADFRDMDGDSRADYAVVDWYNGLAVGIQTGGRKNCPQAQLSESRRQNLRDFKWGNSYFAAACESVWQFALGGKPIAGLDRRQETIRKVGGSTGEKIHTQLRKTPHRGGRE